MIVVTVGCSSDPVTTTTTTTQDSTTPVTDTGTTKKDTGTPAVFDTGIPVVVPDTGVADTGSKPDSGKPVEVDAGRTPGAPPCYNQDSSGADLLQLATNDLGFGYHNAYPRASGCSAGDITAVVNVLREQGARPEAGPDAFRSFQYSYNTLSGVSASCKACIGSEYQQTGENEEAYKWGPSGLRTDPALTQYNLPSNRNFFNFFGCTEARGILTEAEAQAVSDFDACTDLACQLGETASSCGAQGSAKERACVSFAANAGGACESLTEARDAAVGIIIDAKAFDPGVCGDLAGVLNAFCGLPVPTAN